MLNVALLQLPNVGSDQDANLTKGEAFCRLAKEMGADIALFPEMWQIGYNLHDPKEPGSRERWAAQAISRDSPFIRYFRALASELDMAIAMTYLEVWPGRPRNSISLIDRHGTIVLTYAKVHTCEFDVESALTPGDDFYVAKLDTAAGEVQVGAMICFDREFPESARILMLKGAEIILTPNCCTLEINRLTQFRTRAYENMLGVAMANYSDPPNVNGHSVAFDGIAFSGGAPDVDGVSRDMLIVEAGEAPGVYLAPFDLAALRHYREVESWGNAYRRPRLYGALIDEAVRSPFARADATR